jgi:hypothetical protein
VTRSIGIALAQEIKSASASKHHASSESSPRPRFQAGPSVPEKLPRLALPDCGVAAYAQFAGRNYDEAMRLAR